MKLIPYPFLSVSANSSSNIFNIHTFFFETVIAYWVWSAGQLDPNWYDKHYRKMVISQLFQSLYVMGSEAWTTAKGLIINHPTLRVIMNAK